MWELLTRGSTPYPGVNSYHVKDYVATGKRLDKPTVCPQIIYEFMCKCWEENPDNRPSFVEIAEFLGNLINASTNPSSASDGESGFSYTDRSVTKNIQEDYLYAEEAQEEDYMMGVPCSMPEPPNSALPTASKISNDYSEPEPNPNPKSSFSKDDVTRPSLARQTASNDYSTAEV